MNFSSLCSRDQESVRRAAELSAAVYREPTGKETDFQDIYSVNRAMFWTQPGAVAFRGTNNFSNAIQDVQCGMQPLANSNIRGRVHRGFQEALLRVNPSKIVKRMEGANESTWLVTGHSLGGAMATLFAQFCLERASGNVVLVTFGAPHPGDSAFQQEMEKHARSGRLRIVRMTNHLDPVPSLPGVVAGEFRHPCSPTFADVLPAQICHTVVDFVSMMFRNMKWLDGCHDECAPLHDLAKRNHSMDVYVRNIADLNVAHACKTVMEFCKAATSFTGVPLPPAVQVFLDVFSAPQCSAQQIGCQFGAASVNCFQESLANKLSGSLSLSHESASEAIQIISQGLQTAAGTGRADLTAIEVSTRAAWAYAIEGRVISWFSRWSEGLSMDVLKKMSGAVLCGVTAWMKDSYGYIRAFMSGEIDGFDTLKAIMGAGFEAVCLAAGGAAGAWACCTTAVAIGLTGPIGWLCAGLAGLAGTGLGAYLGKMLGTKLRGWFHEMFGGSPDMAKLRAYKELGLSSSASPDEIRTAFKHLALQRHPDKGGDKEAFHRLRMAYGVLCAAHSTCPEDKIVERNFETKAIMDGWTLNKEVELLDDAALASFKKETKEMQVGKLEWLLASLKGLQEKVAVLRKDLRNVKYHTLGLSPGASKAQLTKAYHQLALKLHPDKKRLDSDVAFKNLQSAYKELLSCVDGSAASEEASDQPATEDSKATSPEQQLQERYLLIRKIVKSESSQVKDLQTELDKALMMPAY
ncbi:unnamed protein product [Effrenium voratum]|uniref:J domain-containing protein n=1 Tax=Effrenium voratum TaxID=2562239 RepID=A0AA36I9X5_9DINO|nr:unnamed protein product [Effrenium voratum]CAJ1413933.1 unnamed protein product [Effrenium voratum]